MRLRLGFTQNLMLAISTILIVYSLFISPIQIWKILLPLFAPPVIASSVVLAAMIVEFWTNFVLVEVKISTLRKDSEAPGENKDDDDRH